LETGESTFEPLHLVAADDPVTCAIYGKDNDLLDQPGWKRFKRIAKRLQKLLRFTNQALLRSYRTVPTYQYGFLVPKGHDQAVKIDRKNGNTKWQDSERDKIAQLKEYDTFTNHGKKGKPPLGYKRIMTFFIYAVKHDGRHKSRLVAGGHMTDIPLESVYSRVVTLKGLWIIMFLAELNGLDIWATDVGNAYLEAKTQEKVYIIGRTPACHIQGLIRS
jgi:hypothetical protein